MTVLIIGLCLLGLLALLLGYFHNRDIRQRVASGEQAETSEVVTVDAECCGQHATCEKESLLAAVSKQIEYYDDEELDRYSGIESQRYTEAKVEEFREIFYTMQETDVAGWVRSLQLRHINLPDALKDEVFLVIGERRIH
ncbi:MAG: phospholipase [Bacteroides sp.]|nr:phospholipase [Bacteroides sp.]